MHPDDGLRVSEDQADFARAKGFVPAGSGGTDNWVSPNGHVRIYPRVEGDGVVWVAAIFRETTDDVPFVCHEYAWFKQAIAVYADETRSDPKAHPDASDRTQAIAEFARRLKAAREATGLTQTEAAQRLGMPRQGFAQYERGRRTPAWNRVQEWAEVLGLDVRIIQPEWYKD